MKQTKLILMMLFVLLGMGKAVAASSTVIDNYEVGFQAANDDVVGQTEGVDLVFEKQKASIEVGTGVVGTTSNAPLQLNFCNSETVSLYTGEMLGLKAGDKIQSITYRAYCTSAREVKTNLTVYYQWTDEQSISYTSSEMYDTESMNKIMDVERIWEQTDASSTEMVDYIVINFDKPLVYEANKSLKMVLRSTTPEGMSTTNYKSVTFESAPSSGGYWCYGYSDDTTLDGKHVARILPAIHLGLVDDQITFSGTVKNEAGKVIGGATVTLYDAVNDVKYQSTTDADGKFSINVIRHMGNFKVTVTAAAYEDLEVGETVNFSEGSIADANYVLKAAVEPVTFKYEYTSFSSKRSVDISTLDDVKVYIATEKPDGKTIIEEVTTKELPAGIGVVLRNCGESMTYNIPVIQDVDMIIPGNILIGTADDTYTVTSEDEGYVYRFVYGKESQRCGFQKAKAGQTVSPGKAYLRLSKAGAAEFIGFEDTTGIVDLVIPADENAPMYDLSGRRVSETYKGFVIQNGVKRVLK